VRADDFVRLSVAFFAGIEAEHAFYPEWFSRTKNWSVRPGEY
jgi:hypothetical protein